MEFVEDELLISKGRLEGEDDVIKKGEIDDDSEQGRYIARAANRVGGAMVGVEVPPALDDGGREEPCHKSTWVHEVDDGDHGGNKADDIDGPSVNC